MADDDIYDDDIYDHDYTIAINDHINNITIHTPYYTVPDNILNRDIIYTYINNIIYDNPLTDEQIRRIIEYLSAFR